MKPILLLAVALAGLVSTAASAADKKLELKTKPYPMDTCVVSGEKLDSMGEPFVFVEGSQEVQLCCKSCQKDFNRDKSASLAKIKTAAAKVKPFRGSTCVVSGETLESEKAVGLVYKGREIVLCCEGCVKDFKKKPDSFVAKLDAKPAPAKP